MRTRRSPLRMPLSPSIELRYSISVVAVPTNRYACGYVNSARFYLYSNIAKKRVGNEWRTTFAFTKKTIKAARGAKPSVYEPKPNDLQQALEQLLNQNANLSPDCKIKKKKQLVSVQLNANELLVFWLTHFDSIFDLVTSSYTASDLNKRMAKVFMNPDIASFDLSGLCELQSNKPESACKALVSQVKKTITGNEKEITGGVKAVVQWIQAAVKCYLAEKNIDSASVLKILQLESRVKEGPVAKTTGAMQVKSLPLTIYRELWSNLTAINDAEHIALLTMIFLGLTAEEVCGLQNEDFRPIPDRPGYYQFRIIHQYSIEKAKKYNLEILNEEYACRNIPLPFQIRERIEPFADNRSKESPFLFHNGDQPLKPNCLNKKLKECLSMPTNSVIIKDNHGKRKEVDLAFPVRAYRESCRFYWKYYCRLTDGEIRYLSAMLPPDTASAHYIDFNNGSMQYRMLKQMEHGLAMFANEDKNYPPRREWTSATSKPFYSSGKLNKRASMDLYITSQTDLEISSNRGIIVCLEESDS